MIGHERIQGANGGTGSAWKIGQWVQYDVKATTGITGKVNAVYDGAAFVADQRAWALAEATRDMPILGALDPGTLAATAFGHPWRPLDLPLVAGKSWTSDVPIPDEVGRTIVHRVEFTAKAATVFLPGRQETGFTVVGLVEGAPAVLMSYSPSLHLPLAITLQPPGSEAPTWDALLREEGKDWDGSVWAGKAHVLVEDHALMAPNEDDPTSPYAEVAFAVEFPGPEAHETVFGYLVAVAVGGVAHVQLLDPQGERTEATAVGAPAHEDVRIIDAAGQPGTWRAVGGGAGAVAFTAAYLWAVELQRWTLGEPAS